MRTKQFFATLCVVWFLSAWPGMSFGQGTFQLTRITGQELSVNVTALIDGVLATDEGEVALDELILISTGKQVDARAYPTTVILSGGGQLGVQDVQFDGEQFLCTRGGIQITVSPEAVKAIRIGQEDDMARFNRAVSDRSVEMDTVIARTANGQGVVRGIIETIDNNRLMLNHNGKSRPVSLNKIIGIVTADLKPQQPAANIGMVQLTDGSTVAGRMTSMEGSRLRIGLAGNSTVDFSIGSIASVSLKSERVAFLSDLEPFDSSQSALAAPEYQWQRDKNVAGNPMRLRSPKAGSVKEFAKGIGVHSACRIEFDNVGKFDQFSATVGIDAEMQGNGNCIASVWGDGIKLWESEVTGDGEPMPIDVNIDGMKRVALVVRNGKHLDLADHLNWAEARFLKTK